MIRLKVYTVAVFGAGVIGALFAQVLLGNPRWNTERCQQIVVSAVRGSLAHVSYFGWFAALYVCLAAVVAIALTGHSCSRKDHFYHSTRNREDLR